MKNNIILIGFMGVGKGTTARAFSKEFGLYNLDTDDLIESKENKRVKKIFEESGEAYFRSLEQETANWLVQNVDNTLISCGGGFFKVNNLNEIGKVVLLHASYKWIYERITNSENAKQKLKKRPLFNDPKEAKKLYKEREDAYKHAADIIVTIEGKSTDEIIHEIAAQVFNPYTT